MSTIESPQDIIGLLVKPKSTAEALSSAQELERQLEKNRLASNSGGKSDLLKLGATLIELASVLAYVGRREQAISLAQEAVRVYRKIYTGTPEETEGLASAVFALSSVYSSFEMVQEARKAAREGVDLYQMLVSLDSDKLPRLGGALLRYAEVEAYQSPEKAKAIERATDVYTQLYQKMGTLYYAYRLIGAIESLPVVEADAYQYDPETRKIRLVDRLLLAGSRYTDNSNFPIVAAANAPTEREQADGNSKPPNRPPTESTPTIEGDDMEERIKRLETLSEKSADRLIAIERDLATIKVRSETLATDKDLTALRTQAGSFATEAGLLRVAAEIRKDMKTDLWVLLGGLVTATGAIIGVILRHGVGSS